MELLAASIGVWAARGMCGCVALCEPELEVRLIFARQSLELDQLEQLVVLLREAVVGEPVPESKLRPGRTRTGSGT